MKRRTTEWNLRDILKSLIDAWETVPREIVICSFQRTHFRTDDHFLHIDCDFWDSLQTGVSFKRFVTFDDDLSEEPIVSSRYHSYNLRTSRSAVVQINEDNEDELGFVNSKERNPSDKDQNRRQRTRLPENPVAAAETRKLGSRSFWEAQSTGKRDSVVDGIVKSKAFKRDTFLLREHQTESTGIIGSVQAIIDEALSLTTTAKADYTRKLIDSIYASKSSNETFKDSNAEPNDVPSNSSATCGSNQTSIPFSEENTLSENVAQPVSGTTEEACTSEGASDKTSTSDTRQGMPDGNLKLMPDTRQDIPELTNKKRRMLPGSNGSGHDTDDSESDKKKLKTDYDWSKQFQTTFVFGPPGSIDYSPRCDRDEDRAISCIFHTTHSVSPRN